MDTQGFYTKVVGVTKCNDDGRSRQDIIAQLSPGDRLYLEREPYNDHDGNAIRVVSPSGDQIGYLRATVAAELAPEMDDGLVVAAMVTDITGGHDDDSSYGCNIRIEPLPAKQPSVSDAPDLDTPTLAAPDSRPMTPRKSKRKLSVSEAILILFSALTVIVIFMVVIVCAVSPTDDQDTVPTAPVATTTATPTRSPREIMAETIRVNRIFTGWPNSADGVDLYIDYTNISGRTIKYIYFGVVPYNAVGDIEPCDIRGYSIFTGRCTGPIAPGEGSNPDYPTHFECAWYNSDIREARIASIKVVFLDDGSTISCNY